MPIPINKQPHDFPPTAGLTLQKIFPIQDDGGGVVEKCSVQQFITFIQTLGVVGGSLLFPLMVDLKATTVLVHKTILYNTIGDPTIPEDAGQWYYDQTSMLADNGRSILIPNSINPLNPGRFIQRQ